MPAIGIEKSSPDNTRLTLVRGCAENIEPDHAELQERLLIEVGKSMNI